MSLSWYHSVVVRDDRWKRHFRFVIMVVTTMVLVGTANLYTVNHSFVVSAASSTTSSATTAICDLPQKYTRGHSGDPTTGITTIQNLIRQQQHPFYQIRKRILHQQFKQKQSSSKQQQQHSYRSPHTTTSTASTKRKYRYGTRLTWSFPTPERLIQWYNTNVKDDPRNSIPIFHQPNQRHSSDRMETTTSTTHTMIPSMMVNHPWAGMTNPTVQYNYPMTDSMVNRHSISHQKKKKKKVTQDVVVAATRTNTIHTNRNDHINQEDDEKKWWPPVSSLLQQQQQLSASSLKRRRWKKHWRVLQYRQTVGYGYDCYQTCRDAMLQWEFQHPCTQHQNHDHEDSTLSQDRSLPPPKDNQAKFSFPKFTFHREQGIITLPQSPFESDDRIRMSRRRRKDGPRNKKLTWLAASVSTTTTGSTTDTTAPTNTNNKNNSNNNHMETTCTTQQISYGPGKRMITYTSTPTLSLRWCSSSSSSHPNHHHRYPKMLHVINHYLLHRLPKFYVINPVTVLYNVVDQYGGGHSFWADTTDANRNHYDTTTAAGGVTPYHPNSITTTTTSSSSSSVSSTTYTSTAYGTGYGHWLCGEERVTVCYRHPTILDDNQNTGCVDVEIVSYSQPNIHSFMGRLVYPIIRPLQQSFFVSQMKYLQNIAQTATQPTGTTTKE